MTPPDDLQPPPINENTSRTVVTQDEPPALEGVEIPINLADALPEADEPEGVPHRPRSLAETGLDEDLLLDLALKHLHQRGALEVIELAERLALDHRIVSELLDRLRQQELIATRGGSAMFGGVRIRWAITERGRKRIDEILPRDSYLGPAPVSFAQYLDLLDRQSLRDTRVTPERVERAFGRLVLDQALVERIGPAIASARSIFLYGPPGNGKTSLADCITEAIGGTVYVPHAVVIESEIIRIFDELYHARQTSAVEHDPRWVLTGRPVVVVGGELTLERLDLTSTPHTTAYEAPFQVKANGGVLFIDDFGRQRVNPRDLLNRWIVPLENGYDFLTFRSGQKIKVPFDTLLVFSTNLDPRELADEAFLRRIRYKIEVGDPSEASYRIIFRRECDRRGLTCEEAVLDHLLARHYRSRGRPLRACHPRDLLEQLVDEQRYTGELPKLTNEVIDRLCAVYFVDGPPKPGTPGWTPPRPPPPLAPATPPAKR
jgi:DNA-binding MarR family transcriptional regulator